MEVDNTKGLEALRSSLERDILRFDTESGKHKRLHRTYQRGIIILTAVTTVVAGSGLILPEQSGRIVQFIVLCLTATSAAISAWAGLRRARELWQHERDVYFQLLDIKRELEFVAANRELKASDLEGFFRRIGEVLGSSTTKWKSIAEKKEN